MISSIAAFAVSQEVAMLGTRFGWSLLHATLAGSALWVAVHHVHNAWGLVILAWCYAAGFGLLLNTLDLLTCGRLRQGRGPTRARPVVEEPVIVRRVILEEIRRADVRA